MNHLAHFRLALGEPTLLVGTFLGDQIKGRLTGRFHPQVEFGIQLHRKIDAYTDAHAIVKRSYGRLDPKFRRYCPILMDIFYDHILARNWQEFHHEALQDFNDWVFATLEAWHDELPDESRSIARRMEQSQILLRYADPGVIPGILASVGSRLRRAKPLAEAYRSLQDNLPCLEADFGAFFPELLAHVEDAISSQATLARKTGEQ